MSTINQVVIEDRVRAVAHSLWIEDGMPDGRAESHWFKALEQVNAEAQPQPEAAPAKAKPQRKAPAAIAAAKKPAARKTSKS